MVTVTLEDDGVNLPRMRKTNNSNIPENYSEAAQVTFYTVCACAKGFCPSVSLFVSLVKNEQHTDLLICHFTKQELSRTSRYLHIT